MLRAVRRAPAAPAATSEVGITETDTPGGEARWDGHVVVPHPLALLRHVTPNVVEAVAVPTVMLFVLLHVAGMRWSIIAGLAYSYLAIGRRVVFGRRVTGLLVLAAVSMTVRSVLALAVGSLVVYFAQPLVGVACTGLVFLASALIGQPLTARLVGDFVPLPASLLRSGWVRRFFTRVAILWGVVFLTNAVVSLKLLASLSAAGYVVSHTALADGLIGLGVTVSSLWFALTLRREAPGSRLRFAARSARSARSARPSARSARPSARSARPSARPARPSARPAPLGGQA